MPLDEIPPWHKQKWHRTHSSSWRAEGRFAREDGDTWSTGQEDNDAWDDERRSHRSQEDNNAWDDKRRSYQREEDKDAWDDKRRSHQRWVFTPSNLRQESDQSWHERSWSSSRRGSSPRGQRSSWNWTDSRPRQQHEVKTEVKTEYSEDGAWDASTSWRRQDRRTHWSERRWSRSRSRSLDARVKDLVSYASAVRPSSNQPEHEELTTEDWVELCGLDDRAATLMQGIPENVRSGVIRGLPPRKELPWDEFFEFVCKTWVDQLGLHPRSDVVNMFSDAPEEARRIVMMKFDPTRSKDGNIGARLKGFLRSVVRTSNFDHGFPFTANVPDCKILEKDIGRVLGDRGGTMKQVTEVICDCLKHNPKEHGHAPIVQLCRRGGDVHFELSLYHPFNNADSFEIASNVVREMVNDIIKDESLFAAPTKNCKLPDRVQLDDWECPNPDCRNLCFARRWTCLLCNTPKPKDWRPAHLAVEDANTVQIGDVKWHARRTAKVMTTKEYLAEEQPAAPGHCRIVWLVLAERRGRLTGKQGCKIQAIKEQSGLESLLLTREVEVEEHFGQHYVLAFLTGSAESTRQGLKLINAEVGGRLASDGFEKVLEAAAGALEEERGCRMPLHELVSISKVIEAMHDAEDVMNAAGLRSLIEVLEQWPEQFHVKHISHKVVEVTWLPGLDF